MKEYKKSPTEIYDNGEIYAYLLVLVSVNVTLLDSIRTI